MVAVTVKKLITKTDDNDDVKDNRRDFSISTSCYSFCSSKVLSLLTAMLYLWKNLLTSEASEIKNFSPSTGGLSSVNLVTFVNSGNRSYRAEGLSKHLS